MKSRVIHQLPLLYFFLCNSIRLSTGQVSFLIPWLSCSSCLPASTQYNLQIGKCLKWAGVGRRTSIRYCTSIHALPFSLHLGFSHTVSLSILQMSSNRPFQSSFSRHFSRRLVCFFFFFIKLNGQCLILISHGLTAAFELWGYMLNFLLDLPN